MFNARNNQLILLQPTWDSSWSRATWWEGTQQCCRPPGQSGISPWTWAAPSRSPPGAPSPPASASPSSSAGASHSSCPGPNTWQHATIISLYLLVSVPAPDRCDQGRVSSEFVSQQELSGKEEGSLPQQVHQQGHRHQVSQGQHILGVDWGAWD